MKNSLKKDLQGNEFYLGSTWKIGNKDYHLYMCEGARSRGKTTVWLHAVTKRAINYILDGDTKHKFVYLRRSTVQLQLVAEKGLYNSCREVYKDFYDNFKHERMQKSSIYLSCVGKDGAENFIHVGYYTDLNNVKGISIEDADVILFDEYIEFDRTAYKGGEAGMHEPELFGRLCETIFRKREFWAILLGNHDRSTNPYNEYFHVPYGAMKYKDLERGVFYEFDKATDATRQTRIVSVLGKMFKGTTYNSYALGDSAAVETADEFIAQKPDNSVRVANLRIFGKTLTIWVDKDTNIEYISDKYKIDANYPIISVTRDDMSVSSEFLAYNSQFLLMQRMYYGMGKVRYSSSAVAELFYTMLSMGVRYGK